MKLYVARHGQTLWNTQKRMQGWENSDLTDLGKNQAKLLGKALADIEFNQVISSPLGRTIETANLIIGHRDLRVITNDNFKEMGFGSWEGQTPDILKATYLEQYSTLWADASKYTPVDGETFDQVLTRIKQGLNQIVSKNPSGNVLLVTHGMVIQILLMYAKGLSFSRLWDRKVVYPTSLSILEITPDNIKILEEDNTNHLI